MTLASLRLAALAQDARLRSFRLLVQAGREGLPAGEIARALNIPANTLSAQMTLLANAGLVRGRREGRRVIYAANFDAMAELLAFLMEDCCQGHPEVCAPVAEAVARAARCGRPQEGAVQ